MSSESENETVDYRLTDDASVNNDMYDGNVTATNTVSTDSGAIRTESAASEVDNVVTTFDTNTTMEHAVRKEWGWPNYMSVFGEKGYERTGDFSAIFMQVLWYYVQLRYMGELEPRRGYNLYESGSEVELLAVMTNTLPCPGYIFPLICDDSAFAMSIRELFNGSKTFALISSKDPDGNRRNIYPYGVTMDIFEHGEHDGLLFIKARGLQRFKIIKLDLSLLNKIGKVLVKILPEKRNESILRSVQIGCLNNHRHAANIQLDYKLKGCRRFDSSLCTLPYWVYRLNEPELVVKESLNHIKIFYKFDEEEVPKDPIKLSYWFSQNILFKQELCLRMLSFDSAIERLRFGLQQFHNSCRIRCKCCTKPIGNVRDFISMSKEGYISSFCNPAGIIFETITLSKVTGVSRTGTSSKDYSWFPGYAWTIAQCSYCHTHLGWMFSNYRLNPKFFWGIVKGNVFIDGSQLKK